MSLPRPHVDTVVLHELPDGTHALTDATRGTMLVVNDIGAAVWLLLQDADSLGDVVGRVTAILDVDPGRVETDVAAFVEALVHHGFAG